MQEWKKERTNEKRIRLSLWQKTESKKKRKSCYYNKKGKQNYKRKEKKQNKSNCEKEEE